MGEKTDKAFYRLREVCELTDTQPYVLRFWQSEFPELQPQRSPTGQWVYTRQHVEMVRAIKKLLYEEEYTLAAAREHLQRQADAGSPPRPPDRPSSRRGRPQRSPHPAKDVETGEAEDLRAEIQRLQARVLESEERWRQAEGRVAELERRLQQEGEKRARAVQRLEALLRRLQPVPRPGSRPSARRPAPPSGH